MVVDGKVLSERKSISDACSHRPKVDVLTKNTPLNPVQRTSFTIESVLSVVSFERSLLEGEFETAEEISIHCMRLLFLVISS